MTTHGQPRRGPELIVIGGMKCGSTTLHSYLAEHPDIAMARDKELNYFVAERNWARGWEWYTSQFDPQAPLRGETSPNYTKASLYAGVAERIAEALPEVKIVYIVRDPVERTLSHYAHNVAEGQETRSIVEALLESESNHYLECSRYAKQLAEYDRRIDSERIHVLLLEELSRDPVAVLRRLYDFLEVEPEPAERASSVRLNPRSRRRKTAIRRWLGRQRGSTRLRRAAPKTWVRAFDRATTRPIHDQDLSEIQLGELQDRLRPDAQRLEQRLGRRLPWPTLREGSL